MGQEKEEREEGMHEPCRGLMYPGPCSFCKGQNRKQDYNTPVNTSTLDRWGLMRAFTKIRISTGHCDG
jgi:hypothetical protein